MRYSIIAGYPEQQHKLAERLLRVYQSKGFEVLPNWFEHGTTQLTTQQIATKGHRAMPWTGAVLL